MQPIPTISQRPQAGMEPNTKERRYAEVSHHEGAHLPRDEGQLLPCQERATATLAPTNGAPHSNGLQHFCSIDMSVLHS